MKLIDNSGGFWTNLIVRRKNADLAISQNLLPNSQMMRVVANEAISSIKGSTKHKIIAKLTNGELTLQSSTNGEYSYGIKKRISPDGTPYERLSNTTLRMRKWKAEHGEIPSARGADYILRETSKHIYNGLKVLSVKIGRKNAYAEIGWTGEDETIAKIQDGGDTITEHWSGQEVVLPPRPFRGFQQEFIDNFFNILNQVYK